MNTFLAHTHTPIYIYIYIGNQKKKKEDEEEFIIVWFVQYDGGKVTEFWVRRSWPEDRQHQLCFTRSKE